MTERQPSLSKDQLEQALKSPLPNDQLFQARLKANDYVINYLKYLILLSSGMFLLTTVFLKDILGPHAELAIWKSLIPTAWIFLASCLISSILGFGRITHNLDVPDMDIGHSGLPRAFLAGSKIMCPSARHAIWSFVGALLSFMMFAVANFVLFF